MRTKKKKTPTVETIRIPYEHMAFADARCADLVRRCCLDDNIIESITRSCYLQGVQDGVQLALQRPDVVQVIAPEKEVSMPKLPSDVLHTRDQYVAKFPLWSMPEGEEAEKRARDWTLGLCSQLAFSHPNQGYGSKQADPTRPPSKDAIAQQSGSTLLAWDMLTGAGTGSPSLVQNPDSMDVTGQVFLPVTPADMLSGAAAPPTGGGGGSTPSGDVIPYNESYAIEFGLACNDVYTESGAAMDPGMISVHSQRAAWDYYVGGVPWPDAKKGHINNFRAVYGLPPI